MTKTNPSLDAFKVWIFPSLVSILAMLIWNDVSEIKADVKQLMAQSNIDKTRIDNLERQIYKTTSTPLAPVEDGTPKANEYAVLPDSKIKTVKYVF